MSTPPCAGATKRGTSFGTDVLERGSRVVPGPARPDYRRWRETGRMLPWRRRQFSRLAAFCRRRCWTMFRYQTLPVFRHVTGDFFHDAAELRSEILRCSRQEDGLEFCIILPPVYQRHLQFVLKIRHEAQALDDHMSRPAPRRNATRRPSNASTRTLAIRRADFAQHFDALLDREQRRLGRVARHHD